MGDPNLQCQVNIGKQSCITSDDLTKTFVSRTSGSGSSRTGIPGIADGSEEDNLGGRQLLESVTVTTDFCSILITTTSDVKL